MGVLLEDYPSDNQADDFVELCLHNCIYFK